MGQEPSWRAHGPAVPDPIRDELSELNVYRMLPTGCEARQALRTSAASPVIDTSSGKHQRHRLNRGGDRQSNSALWTIAICPIGEI